MISIADKISPPSAQKKYINVATYQVHVGSLADEGGGVALELVLGKGGVDIVFLEHTKNLIA